MKFLITGGMRSPAGPRRLVAFTLLFLALFILFHGLREYHGTGFLPASIRANLFGATAEPEPGMPPLNSPRSALMVLEDLHVDLLLYSLSLLFIGSVLQQTGYAARFRQILVMSVFLVTIIYALARAAVLYQPLFEPLLTPSVYVTVAAWVVSIFFICFHALTLFLIVLCLWDLYRPRGKAAGGET